MIRWRLDFYSIFPSTVVTSYSVENERAIGIGIVRHVYYHMNNEGRRGAGRISLSIYAVSCISDLKTALYLTSAASISHTPGLGMG